jgi:hypothetical protein
MGNSSSSNTTHSTASQQQIQRTQQHQQPQPQPQQQQQQQQQQQPPQQQQPQHSSKVTFPSRPPPRPPAPHRTASTTTNLQHHIQTNAFEQPGLLDRSNVLYALHKHEWETPRTCNIHDSHQVQLLESSPTSAAAASTASSDGDAAQHVVALTNSLATQLQHVGVDTHDIAAIASSSTHAICFTFSGHAYCWATNNSDQAASCISPFSFPALPTEITSLGSFKVQSVACGAAHSVICTLEGLSPNLCEYCE